MSSSELQQLEITIQGLESQRSLLGDALVDAALAPLRSRLAKLRVEATQHRGQALKHVSIVFVDVVGSTSLAQHLDAEEVSAVMDGALSRGTALVEAHRGKVLQYAGDNILAGFGVDRATEDDAERAVRCGLALLELGKALGQEVEAAHGHPGFDLRVEIHSGGVLLGGGVDEDGTIRGIAVNIAARMEQTAPPGGLRISHDTYAQVRGVFDVEPQPPLSVKGVDAPVRSYLVVRARPRAFRVATRGIEGIETRMIGRAAELQALQDAFLRVTMPAAGMQRVLVVADPGVGKSRLLYEFDNWMDARPERVCIFRARAAPQRNELMQINPQYTIEQTLRLLPFTSPEPLEHFVEGLRKSGIAPELQSALISSVGCTWIKPSPAARSNPVPLTYSRGAKLLATASAKSGRAC